MRKAIIAAALAAFAVSGAHAERISTDYGGDVQTALVKGFQLKARKEPFTIEGRCYSACTLTADRARPFTCVQPGSRLYFHRSTITDSGRTITIFSTGQVVNEGRVVERNVDMSGYYSADLQSWIRSQGGLPPDSKHFLEMPYATALQFFRKCGKKDEWG